MASEYERRRFLEWAERYAEKHGYDPQTIDAAAWYDSTLTFAENKENIRQQYPAQKSGEQIVEDMGRRNTAQYAKYADTEGSRQRMEEVKAARKPSLLDKFGEIKEKYVDEPQRRRETEHYFKTKAKIKERQERLKVKEMDRKERQLAEHERALDKEAYNASFEGRITQSARSAIAAVGTGGRSLRRYGLNPRPSSSTTFYTDTGIMRNMLAPGRSPQSSSPLYSQRGGNSIILGLLGGQPKAHRHYVTVIEHGQARRVYLPEGQEYSPQGQAPPPQSRQTATPPLLNLGMGNPNLKERFTLGNAKYGYSRSKPKKKMPKFI